LPSKNSFLGESHVEIDLTRPSVERSEGADTLSRGQMLEIFGKVDLIRRSEDVLGRMLRAGALSFGFYPVGGQEIAPAVLTSVLAPDDQMVATYRGLADHLAKGLSLFEIVAEHLGRSDGTCRGLGGPMEIIRPDKGLMMTTGIVGSGAPIAAGLALAAQLQGSGKVVAVSFGDGATSIGAVHEAMLFAGLWKLPVIFVCHNNHWAEGTPLRSYSPIERLADRAAGYGMPGVSVDGTDPQALFEAFVSARDRARQGLGPTFVESLTYRLTGHYFADTFHYADKEELAAQRARDPVLRLRARLVSQGFDESELAAIEKSNAGIVETDIARIHEVPDAVRDEAALHEHVFADPGYTPISICPPPPVPVPHGKLVKATMRDALNDALVVALERDPSVFMLGEDIGLMGGVFGVTRGLLDRFGGERIRNTPIAEQGILGAALGAAIGGMRPIAELMFMDFLPIVLDQLANHAAKARFVSAGAIKAPLTIMTLVGQNNGPQHSQSLEAWLMHTPGLKVAYPSNPTDAKGLLLSAIFDDDPCVVIESGALLHRSGEAPEGDYRVPFGAAAISRKGDDVTIIAYGPAVGDSLLAAETLAAEGVSAEVIDLRTLAPIDGATILASVRRTGRAVVVHRAIEFMGPSAEIAAFIQRALFGELKAPVGRVGAAFTPVPKSPSLGELHYKGAAAIAAAVREII
jgi:pyruvate/2-oxoglutarate/acetoin dehydrogenase E1 component/TPP-dependent pyruvate/acetoin dehydrogenase alpha subunit